MPDDKDVDPSLVDEGDAIETTETAEEKVSAPLAPPASINLFQHPDAHPAVLDFLLLQKYGAEWLGWEPETLQERILGDFHTSAVSDLNMSKIQAMKTLHLVNTPWKTWEVFLWTAMPLNGLFPDFWSMQVPTPAQCLVAIDIFRSVRRDIEWGDEVKNYLAVVWRHEGMFVPTEPAEFVQVDAVGTGADVAKIREMWPSVRKDGVAPRDETVDAEQLRRMLDAHKYLLEERSAFDQQATQVGYA
jgi:hypothetical protein